MKKIHMAALALVGVMLGTTACEGMDTATDPNLTPPVSASGKAGKSAKDDGLLDVTYKITGKASRGMITYTTPSGTEQTTDDLPWTKKLKVKAHTGAFLSISVQNESESGDVMCLIYVDGKPVKRAQSRGAYAIASCDHSMGF